MKIASSALGKNQQYVLDILSSLSLGQNIVNIRYYGGTISNGRRCISIGRECSLHYSIPWWIIDVRHAGEVFRQDQGSRLGTNCQRIFNRAVHSLIKRGLLAVIPTFLIRSGNYSDIEKNIKSSVARQPSKEAVRFVIMVNVRDASGILKKEHLTM